MNKVLFLILLVAIAFFAKDKFYTVKDNYKVYDEQKNVIIRDNYRKNYSCEGKVWCSQMTSCEEATFYLNNCPNVKIDGDGDGIPCERQWCNSW